MDDTPPAFFIGHHDSKRPLPVTHEAVQDAHAANYDMLTSPITTPHFHSRVLALLSSSLSVSSGVRNPDFEGNRTGPSVVVTPLAPADTPLTPDDTTSQVIGTTSPWIDLGSSDPLIADVSRQVLRLELNYAAFCGITHVLIAGPRLNHARDSSGIVQYARSILEGLDQGPYMQLYIWLPMINSNNDELEEIGDLAPFARQHGSLENGLSNKLDVFGTWEAWNTIRSLCRYSARLSVALSLPRLLPPVSIQSRWYSEPVRLLMLDANIFIKNPKGYPVLSRAHQVLISRFLRLRAVPWFLLCNVNPIPSQIGDLDGAGPPAINSSAFPSLAESSGQIKDPSPHLSYMRNLQSKQPALTSIDRFGSGYQDFLQAPLQPLTVNLESITYEVFEKDPVKYDWYERAVAEALSDWTSQRKPTSNPDGRIVVAVVGAGRGPLVTRALKAASSTGVEIDMWALEKNPNAYVLLNRHNSTTWNGKVNLVKSDMRTWRGPVRQANADRMSKMYADASQTQQRNHTSVSPSATFTGSPDTDSTYLLATATHRLTYYKIDILISELLGSFADNELSPECLDGVQHLMNPVHGISIPTNYTAFITPVAAPKIYADINNTMIQTTPNAAETPYVVMLNAIDFLSTRQTASGSTPSPAQSNQKGPQSPLSSHPPDSGTKKAEDSKRLSSIPPSPTANILPTWSFSHPNYSLPSPSPTVSNQHNARHVTLRFAIPNRGTCHGLAGYFESVLYQPSSNKAAPVELSTNPLTMEKKSPDMISWFPIYFPLKHALYVPDGGELEINMWRKTDERKVWYEWIVDVYMSLDQGVGISTEGATSTHTSRGHRTRIGGSDLHSSEKEGCLM